MKNELIKLEADKVTISAKGRAAAYKWKPGDKPFVRFLNESVENLDTVNDLNSAYDVDKTECVQPVGEKNSCQDNSSALISLRMYQQNKRLTLDIGSKLEIQDPQEVGKITIRSTTKVNLGKGPHTCETHWEVFPSDQQ